ncbi:MAG: zinc ribbon domain-containing protein [Tepidisphaeraceae bacterium]
MRLPLNRTISPPPGAFRRWLGFDMRVLRWVFLALYLLIAGPLVVYALTEVSSERWLLFTLIGALVAQAVMIFGTGTIHLCRPIRKHRLILPVAAAAFMLMVLTGGVAIALWELFYLGDRNLPGEEMILLGVIGLSWIVWGVLLFAHVRHRPRYAMLGRLTTFLFAGSLLELLATVPSHVIVSRRPGCLVGLGTMLGIVAGLCVMLFSFGPMIFLLFLRPRYRAELSDTGTPYCPACGYDLRASTERCPECGLPITN